MPLKDRLFFSKEDRTIGGVFISTAIGGEVYQSVVTSGALEYTWATGHVSDIAAPAGFALLLGDVLGFRSKEKALVYWPIYYTICEVAGWFNTTFDVQDIACFWGGSALAFGTSKVIERYRSHSSLDSHLADKS